MLKPRQIAHYFGLGTFKYIKLTQVAKNQFGFATAILWH
jgi:hypothetical protein